MEKVLALIPVRAGSKRLPEKFTPLKEKSLLAWLSPAKLRVILMRLLFLQKMLNYCQAQKWCESSFIRPDELAMDDTLIVVLHALQEVPNYDYVILLQVASPLRLPEDIDAYV